MSRVLILFLHPAYERSRVHRALSDAVCALDGVTFHDLYEHYPDFDIDIDAEQELLMAHDRIVFQHPTYWYSGPPLLKQWQDLVLQYGWAYGTGGHALEGKWAMHVTSTAGGRDSYTHDGYHGYTLPEFIRPLERTATLCRMTWVPPYVVHSSHDLSSQGCDAHAAEYRRLITALIEGRVSLDAAQRLACVSDDLDSVLLHQPAEVR